MKILRNTAVIFALLLLTTFAVDRFIVFSATSTTFAHSADVPAKQMILVLGAQIYGGQVSAILAERLNAAIELWRAGNAQNIIVSGDYSSKFYDEATAMHRYLERLSISGSVIIDDHAGFSTYDSLYRAKHVFAVQSLIIVSQDFHLPRALFIARALGLDAVGFSASRVPLSDKEAFRSSWREPLARMKAVVDVLTGTVPSFTGSGLPIGANGEVKRW